jgi:hypothetical protein
MVAESTTCGDVLEVALMPFRASQSGTAARDFVE